MRLSNDEQATIINTIQSHATGSFELYLHGSRVDDTRKGGDIDLLLLAPDQEKDHFQRNKHIILSDIKEKIGDQKIDLTISSSNQKTLDPFVKIALKHAAQLAKQ